jgi:hypothetical protein
MLINDHISHLDQQLAERDMIKTYANNLVEGQIDYNSLNLNRLLYGVRIFLQIKRAKAGAFPPSECG